MAWLFTTQGFYSVVACKIDHNYLYVRSRVKGDVEKLFLEADVWETHMRDYRYRARLPRKRVIAAIADEISSISYHNYKSAVEDHRRLSAYTWIWSIMGDLKTALMHNSAVV